MQGRLRGEGQILRDDRSEDVAALVGVSSSEEEVAVAEPFAITGDEKLVELGDLESSRLREDRELETRGKVAVEGGREVDKRTGKGDNDAVVKLVDVGVLVVGLKKYTRRLVSDQKGTLEDRLRWSHVKVQPGKVGFVGELFSDAFVELPHELRVLLNEANRNVRQPVNSPGEEILRYSCELRCAAALILCDDGLSDSQGPEEGRVKSLEERVLAGGEDEGTEGRAENQQGDRERVSKARDGKNPRCTSASAVSRKQRGPACAPR